MAKALLKTFYHSIKYYLQRLIIKSSFPEVSFVKSRLSHSSRTLNRDQLFSYSQFGQDLILDKLLGGIANGVFLDVGSNHPLYNSNTAFFEVGRGWTGVCIDPLATFIDLYPVLRPNSTFINYAVSDTNGIIPFSVVSNSSGWEDQLSSTAPSIRGYRSERINVVCKRLDEILSELCYSSSDIDFMSLDVEGHEPSVLRSLGHYRPKYLLVENIFPFYGSNKLRMTLRSMGYVFIKRIWSTDDLFVFADHD